MGIEIELRLRITNKSYKELTGSSTTSIEFDDNSPETEKLAKLLYSRIVLAALGISTFEKADQK